MSVRRSHVWGVRIAVVVAQTIIRTGVWHCNVIGAAIAFAFTW